MIPNPSLIPVSNPILQSQNRKVPEFHLPQKSKQSHRLRIQKDFQKQTLESSQGQRLSQRPSSRQLESTRQAKAQISQGLTTPTNKIPKSLKSEQNRLRRLGTQHQPKNEKRTKHQQIHQTKYASEQKPV